MILLIQIPITQNRLSRNFSSTNKRFTDADENTRLEKNKKLFEIKEEFKTSSDLANHKESTPEQLFDSLKKNKQESSDNCFSAGLSIIEANKIVDKAGHLWSRLRHKLPEEEQEKIDSNVALQGDLSGNPTHSSEEEESLFEIDRAQKKLINALYKVNSVKQFATERAFKKVSGDSKELITELNTLSHNIATLTDSNNKIRTELRNRGVSLIEDHLTAHMDMPDNNNEDL